MILVNCRFILDARTWKKVLTGAEFYPEYNDQQQDHLKLLFVGLLYVFSKFDKFEIFDPSGDP